MNLTAEQIEDNWNKLTEFINKTFDKGRSGQLINMYTHFKDRMILAPASGVEHYHNCFPGGYVAHVLNVINAADKLFEVWKEFGATINYTKEELLFAALNHDLGKIGDANEDYYLPNDSEWHKNNRGELYKHNPKLSYMKVPDRSIFLLQHFAIEMTENEYLGIKLHDGMYVEENKSYFMAMNPGNALKTNLPIILHHADLLASRTENEKWKASNQSSVTKSSTEKYSSKVSKTKSLGKIAETNIPNADHAKMFSDIFNK
jgi:hypothetical protein